MLKRKASLAVMVLAVSFSAVAQSSDCEQAITAFRAHQWAAAADGFAACEAARPGQTEALLYRGKSLINLSRFDDAAAALQSYLLQHPQSDDALYSLAYVRFRQDQPRESLQLFNQAVKVTGPTADDLKIVSLDYVLLHDYSDAAHYLEESLKLDPNNIEARYHLGRARYQLNQFDLAITAFQEVLRRDPGNVKAEDNLGLSFEAKNQVGNAIAAYRKAIQMDESLLTHNEQPYLDLGALLAKSNRLPEALPLLKRASEINPNSPAAQYELAKAWFNLDHVTEARVAAEAAVRLEPDDSSYHYLLGRIYQKLGKQDLSAQQFKATEGLIQSKKSGAAASAQTLTSGSTSARSAAQNPIASSESVTPAPQTSAPPSQESAAAETLRAQAREAAQTGDFEKALSLLLEARKESPHDPDVLYDFGMVALHLSLFSDAAQAFTETLVLRQDDANALYGLGRADIGLTKYQEARDAFAHYLQVRPRDASAHYALGLALAAMQQTADARKQFETSIAEQPVQTESYFQLGLLQLDDKQLDPAAESFQRVLARDPHHAGALTGMGRVAFEKKDYTKAADLLRQAIAADPKLRQPHYYLGLTYARMGQKDDSAKELEIASQIEHEEAERQRLGLKIVNADQPPAH